MGCADLLVAGETSAGQMKGMRVGGDGETVNVDGG